MIFGLKVGLSIGGAISTSLLGVFGYIPDAIQQTVNAVNGIRLLVSVIPGLIFIGGSVLLFGYSINKKKELQIETELNERRNLAGSIA